MRNTITSKIRFGRQKISSHWRRQRASSVEDLISSAAKSVKKCQQLLGYMRSCRSTVKPEKTRAGDHSACGVCRLKAAVTGVIELYSPSTRFHKVARGEKYWVLP